MSQFIGVACIPQKNTGKLTCIKRPLQNAPDDVEFWLKMYYLRTSGAFTLAYRSDSGAAPMLAQKEKGFKGVPARPNAQGCLICLENLPALLQLDGG